MINKDSLPYKKSFSVRETAIIPYSINLPRAFTFANFAIS